MGERYSQLPSTILEQATTMDIFIFDIATKYKNLAQRRAENPNYKPVPNYSQDQLQNMIDRVRSEKWQ